MRNKRGIKIICLLMSVLLISSCGNRGQESSKSTKIAEGWEGTYVFEGSMGQEIIQIYKSYDERSYNIDYAWLTSNGLNIMDSGTVSLDEVSENTFSTQMEHNDYSSSELKTFNLDEDNNLEAYDETFEKLSADAWENKWSVEDFYNYKEEADDYMWKEMDYDDIYVRYETYANGEKGIHFLYYYGYDSSSESMATIYVVDGVIEEVSGI